MSSVKKVSIEFFEDFCIASVNMSDGDEVKMVGIVGDDANINWKAESKSKYESTEALAAKVVFGCFASVVDAVTE